jgi:hypothetical protein
MLTGSFVMLLSVVSAERSAVMVESPSFERQVKSASSSIEDSFDGS